MFVAPCENDHKIVLHEDTSEIGTVFAGTFSPSCHGRWFYVLVYMCVNAYMYVSSHVLSIKIKLLKLEFISFKNFIIDR